VDPCLTFYIDYYEWTTEPQIGIEGMYPGHTEITYCDTMRDRLEEKQNEILASVESLDLTCFRNQGVSIQGGDYQDRRLMQTTVDAACTDVNFWEDWHKVTIYVDAEGRVIDVQGRYPDDPPRPEAIDCIESALAGLVFPCLANYQICPEYLVME
jgi:hypothetical protein